MSALRINTEPENTLCSKVATQRDFLEIIADVDMVHEVVKKLNGYKLIKMVKIENEDNVFRLYLK